MRTIQIGYTSEDIVQGYEKAIRAATTLEELVAAAKFYMPLTADAVALAKSMKAADLEEFLKDAKAARRAKGKNAERIVDRWGDLLMPNKMLEVSIMAARLHVPFGLVFIRMQEAGRL